MAASPALLVDRLVWDRRAAAPLSFAVEAGARVYVCGDGATSLLLALAGFLPALAGRVVCDGRELTHEPAASRHVAYIAGGEMLIARRTLRANVALPGPDRTAAAAALAQVGLSEAGPRAVAALSAAQRRLGALARALAAGPALLLIEESAADPPAIPACLRGLARPAALVATASPTLALAHAESILLLQQGRAVQLANPHDLYERPADRFVASWSGPCNFFPATLEGAGPVAGSVLARVGGHGVAARFRDRATGEVTLAVRPHQLRLRPEGLPARVVARDYQGASSRLTLDAAGASMVLDDADPEGPVAGQTVHVGWDWRHAWPVA